MKTATSSDIVIYDAIHTVMRLPCYLKEILDLAEVQRLRFIRQMALADLVFPTASHSRFSHSLGAAHLALRMLKQLKLYVSIPEELERHVVMAALLHDIGHGPFSHSFEGFLDHAVGLFIRHEVWTQYFLEDTELQSTLKAKGFQSSLLTQFITQKTSLNHNPLSETSLPHLLLGADIIASQLDSDRLDYLLRDSHFCGVSNGTYDLNWLINCLLPVQTQEGYRLGIESKGIGVAENFLLARRLMYKNIYCNAKLVALERILVALLCEVSSLIDEDQELRSILPPPLAHFLTGLKRGAYLTPKALCEDKFSSYQQLCDFDIWNMIRSVSHQSFKSTPRREKLKQLALRFQKRRCPKVFLVMHNQFPKAELEALRAEHGYSSWQIDFVPISFQLYAAREAPILVAEESMGTGDSDLPPVGLNMRSELIDLFSDRPEPQYYLMVDECFYQEHIELVTSLVRGCSRIS